MASRCRVGIMNEDESVDSIYIHYDGYFEGVGQALLDKYNDAEAIRELIADGNHKSLVPTPEPYGGPEEKAENDSALSLYHKRARKDGCDFVYIFNNDEWMAASCRGGMRFAPLEMQFGPR